MTVAHGDRLLPAVTVGGPERRKVSVLFVDLVDFTHYAERADPELIREVQARFFTAVRQVVARYGGVVEKYIGDAVMALFGAPTATECDAVRCVRAGLALERRLTGPAGLGDTGLRFRIGVTSGEVVVDLSAAHDGGQAIATGDVVNAASRLQSAAPLDRTLVCGATYAATRSAIRYAGRPPIILRGRSTPTEVWLAIEPLARTEPGRDPQSGPLIGRGHEFGLLANALQRAIHDRVPQVVTVFGQTGVGKSRLVHELHRHARNQYARGQLDQPVRWLTGRCPPFGDDPPYAALAEIVRAYAGIADSHSDSDAANASAAASASASALPQRLTDALHELVGPDAAVWLADGLRPLIGLAKATLSRAEAEATWRRFLTALASHGPLVLVFEDLHWADELTVHFVQALAASLAEVPLLLLCTARPDLLEHRSTWAGAVEGSLTITLSPLRDAEISELYGHLLGPGSIPAEVLGPLVDAAAGNPLFAQEYAQTLVRQGFAAAMPARRADLPVPERVHAVLANRIDQIEPADRTVLLTASVAGVRFRPGAVAAALGRDTDTVERSLQRLKRRGLVQEQPSAAPARPAEYRFRQAAVQDVCYRRLPRTQRAACLQRMADWLGSTPTDLDGTPTDLDSMPTHLDSMRMDPDNLPMDLVAETASPR